MDVVKAEAELVNRREPITIDLCKATEQSGLLSEGGSGSTEQVHASQLLIPKNGGHVIENEVSDENFPRGLGSMVEVSTVEEDSQFEGVAQDEEQHHEALIDLDIDAVD